MLVASRHRAPKLARAFTVVRLLVSVALVGGIVATVRQGLDTEVAFAATCPAGTLGVPFTWEGAGSGNRAVWPAAIQDSGFSRAYSAGTAPNQFNSTLTVDDPDRINEDGNNPIRATYGGIFNWDEFLPTRSNGAYGAGFLTVVESTLTQDQTLTFEFAFDRPVHIPDFRVGDIDYAGWGAPNNSEPHDGYQDEVEMFGERGGVPVTFSAVPGTATRPVIVSGSKYKGGPYSVGTNGDLAPDALAGQVILATSNPVNSFGFRYSNGPDDADAESTRSTVSGLPRTGVSNNHAIRVDGFTVCVGTLTVGDLVFQDLDGDGVKDPAEPGIPNVTVTLTDPAGNVVATTTTNATGNYTIDRLPPFDYVVTVDRNDPDFPPTLTPSVDPDPTPDGSTPITLTTTSVTNLDFGFKPPPASLAGEVYEDLDNDGIKDPGEEPIEGVTVTLTAADGSTLTTTTDETGAYLFSNLPAGTYTVTETQPTTHLDGKDTAGSKGGTVAPDQITGVTLAAGDVATGYNFGEQPAALIGDFVWNDLNLNGVQDEGEPGIAGVTVTLTGTDDLGGTVNLTTTTDADGFYQFGQLRGGNYTVTFTTPAGYAPTGEDLGGNNDLDSDGLTETVTLPTGTANLSLDSGFSNQAGLFGQVYVDANNNGVRDPGEAPIPGTTITVTGPGGTLSTTTGEDGSYGFPGLPLGTYTVTETQPPGYIDGKDKLGSAGGTLGNDTVTSITLAPGSATGYDFGELQKASLGDFVWEDLDFDGVQDPGEPGIAGVTVTLTGIDDLGATVNKTTTTDAAGAYSFTDLRSGSYEVKFATPAGYTPTGVNAGGDDLVDSDGGAVTELLAWGENNTSIDSGFYRKASIAGSVYVDADNDGVQDAGETPIPGATVKLTGITGAGLPISRTTTTDASGNYSFTDLLPGTYLVTETQPVGFLDGKDAAGSEGGTVAPDAVDAIVLPSGAAAIDYDFGELRPATISGAVFEETLGLPTPGGQTPIPGVTITLTCTDDLGASVTKTTTTAADGTYSFTGLRPGTCTITQTQPPGYTSAPNTPATEIPVTVTEGSTSDTNYFGELRVGQIGNFVWEDLNGDGIQDAGEPGIAGATVTLTGTDAFGAAVNLTDTTDAGGLYLFDNLNPGNYTVTFATPAGFAPTGEDEGTDNAKDSDGLTETVTLGSAEANLTVDSGFVRPASVGNFVWNDLDGDGVQDPGEPGIEGVTVKLTGTDGAGNPVDETVTTGPDGSYLFDDLVPGSYTVTFAPPAGTDPSPADVGNDGSDSDGLTEPVTLESGEANTTVDSGFVLPASIAGSVYVDADDDGVFDPTETPIPGATVTLTGTDAAGNPVTETATTGVDGSYLFDDLAPGTYVVTETQPATFLDGKDAVGSEGGTLGPDTVTAIALQSGDVGVKYDFGELRPATVSGTVFEQTTGSPDPTGQPGIAGVELTLTCTDSSGVVTTQTTTTGADGTYEFENVRPGTCTITQTQPPGYVSAPNTPALEIPVTVVEGSTNPDNDFGELRTTTLGNFVWNDLDGDGVQDAGEPGIAGVTVTLSGSASATTTTDADGKYLFEDLAPGTYTVAFTTPSGFVPTAEDKAADDITDSDGAEATTTLASGQSDLTLDSGFYQPASLAGVVYVDTNDDGNPTGETGIGGVTVTLTGTDGAGNPVTKTTTTAADGTYLFTDLPPGTYVVTETQPAAYNDGKDTAGSEGGTVAPDKIEAVTLQGGDVATGYNFGERPPASLSGTVFEETLGQPTPAGQPGVEGVTLTLTCTDAAGTVTTETTTTDAAGFYQFTGLGAGTCTVTETQPAGFLDAGNTPGTVIASITVAPGDTITGKDFGEVRPASVGDFVWEDLDGDGIQDPTETGVAAVAVTLTGTDLNGDPVSLTTTTDADGAYLFDGLLPGDYVLTFTPPSELIFTASDEGADDALDSDGATEPVTLESGDAIRTIDAGLVAPASLSGHVYADADNDGVRDAGEAPIAGVTVTLTGTDGAGNPVTLTELTAADGSYSFEGLQPGMYTVTETQPVTHADGKDTAGSEGGTVTDDKIADVVLASGDDAVDYDFGELSSTTVSGRVFEETPDSPGIPGVTITLTCGEVLQTTVTGADGSYQFTNVNPGTCTITETQPPNLLDGTTTPPTVRTVTVTPDTPVTGQDFGEVRPAALGNLVWEDTNGNGVQDTGEPGIAAVTVTLTGTDDLGVPVTATTTTGADGSYGFAGLRPGSYEVTFAAPAGFVPTAPDVGGDTTDSDELAATTLSSGETDLTLDRGLIRPASLAGVVWADLNNDGVRDAGEAPVPGTTVTLTGTDGAGNPVTKTTTTGPDGSYAFTGLAPGTYTVSETQPTGFLDGKDVVGTSGGTPTNDVTSAVTLDSGEAATGYDFGELPPARIAGAVFEETLGQPTPGTQPGIPAVTVTLTGTDDLGNPVDLTTTTLPDGTFAFEDLRPGTYTVTETQPSPFVDAPNTPATVIAPVELPAGGNDTDNYFGEVRLGRLGNLVWNDADGDGIQDAGEPGVAGATVTLTGTDVFGAAVSETTTTDAAGFYEFTGLQAGTYTVAFTTPAGFTPTKADAGADDALDSDGASETVTLAAGGENLTLDSGFFQAGSIGGVVWADADNDGIVDPGEAPIPGVTITLTGTDATGNPVTATTTTEPDGSYVFPDLAPGTYTVTETQPTDFLDGLDEAGPTGGTLGPDKVTAIVLTGGNSAPGNNFGELPPASLGDLVWHDIDGDGIQASGEPGIPGVVVTLTGTDDVGKTVNLTDTTAADGTYLFDGLRPGTYTVAFPNPAGFVPTAVDQGSDDATDSDGATEATVLVAGESDLTLDSGFVRPATLAGKVYVDTDNDGVPDAGEAPIAGVTVALSGTDGNGDPVTRTAVTGTDGTYLFEDLAPGTYTVVETQPTGYLDGTDTAGSEGGTVEPDKITAISLVSGDKAVDYNFGEQTTTGLGGRVFEETPGNPGIPGVIVTLTGTDDLGQPVMLTTTTGPDGGYVFPDLRPGTYTVTETQPPSYLDGTTTPPTVITGIVLVAGAFDTGNDFGEVRPARAGNLVWEDLNGDGIQNLPAEPGIAGVTVTLTGTDDLGKPVTATTTTAADGSYLFDNLRPGDYTVAFATPTGYLPTPADTGTDNAADSDGADEATTLSSGEADLTLDSGFVKPASLSGSVFADLDGDGVKDPTDTPIPGVTVTLTGTDGAGNPVTLTTTTLADGTYSFPNLLPGTYTVTETQPPTYVDGVALPGSEGGTPTPNKITSVVLTSGDQATGYDFSELAPGSLGNFVWNDLNADGVQDAGEPGIAGVTVTLDGPVDATTTTAADGSYSFPNLPEGDYTVTFTAPTGFTPTMADAGVDNAVDSDGVTEPVTLPAGGSNPTIDSGFWEPVSLAGLVYADTDNDGVPDTGEAPIPGTTVTLTGTDGAGNPVTRITTTGTDGTYRFDGLAPGTYTVTETQPAGFLDGKDTAGTNGGTVTPDKVTTVVLKSGDDATGYNFGELKPAALTGKVFEEIPTNPGIGGVTVTLTGTDDLGNPVTASTITATDGTYGFVDLRPGTYTVTETQPTGLLDGATTPPRVIADNVLTSGQTDSGNDFGEVRPASVGNFVWNDLDGDGLQDIGEPGIAGATVALTGTDDLGKPVTLTTTTATDGTYGFDNLRPGTYTVAFATPAGHTPTAADSPDDPLDGSDSDGADETVTLASGEANLTIDSGFVKGTSLSGLVFADLDNDGVVDPGEPGIGGATITLTGTDGQGNPVNLTTTTAPDGTYSFPNLVPGVYTVTETQPTGYLDGKDRPGTSGGTVGADKVSTVILVAGVAATGYTFGELPPASLGNLVWDDLNGNGIQDTGEPGIKDVTVTLTGVDDLGNPITPIPTKTDADGVYGFGGLRPGEYTVTFTKPENYQPAPSDRGGNDEVDSDGIQVNANLFQVETNLTVGENDFTIDSGFYKPSSISGTVYVDTDNNGTPETGELGIAGVTVKLTGVDNAGNPVERTTVTDANGAYSFPNLPPGVYAVAETQPTEFLDGKDKAGSAGGTVTPDKLTAITLGRGVAASGYDFGELEPAAIDGRVFEETAGTPGIPGVIVTLTGTDDLGNPVTLTTTTSPLGTYEFTDLRPGTYTVTETQPAGLADGATTPATVISGIVLTAGQTDTGNDFGEVEPASVGNLVWDDRDGDGIQEAGEPGIAGVTVTLTGTDDLGKPVALTTTTKADGTYLFENLRPGTYKVVFATPSGYAPTPTDKGSDALDSDGADETVTLKSGDANLTVDSGFYQPQTLSGTVYFDADNDGILEAGEPGIAGVKITLTDAAGKVVTTTTGPDGSYSFPNLAPGKYTVTETQPVEFADGKDSAGPNGGGTVKPDQIVDITVTSGGLFPANDFGELGWPLAGEVRFDGSGTPIPGVTVTVTGKDMFGRDVNIVVKTDENGGYSVPNLPPGDYLVTETQPVGLGNGIVAPTNVIPVTIKDAGVTKVDFTEKGSAIDGFVFFDANDNDTKDPGEKPIGGVEITLTGTDAAGKPVQLVTKTDADGKYTFTDLVAGTYTITETQPAGYSDGPVIPGSGGGEKGINTVKAITLGVGQTHTNYGFGETVPVGSNPPTSTTSTSTTQAQSAGGGSGGSGSGSGGGSNGGGGSAPIVPSGGGPLAFTGAETQRLMLMGMALLVIGMSWVISLRNPRRREI